MKAGEIFNKQKQKSRILVAPLDWGLGHATRCIPIIRELLILDCEVLIAAEGISKNLLLAEFPGLTFLPIIDYGIKYSRKKNLLGIKIFTQIPRIATIIFNEHKWLKKVLRDKDIDAVISDNRFGLYHKKIPCIYITHQVNIKTGNFFTDLLAKKIHGWFIKKYTACWIPDFAEAPGVAGELSHTAELPVNSHYIGCLSRFEYIPELTKKYDLLFSLSGPEPQRSIFEKLLINEARHFEGAILLIRGLPGKNVDPVEQLDHMEVRDHLTAAQLNEALQSAKFIISRSGYTSIMDYMKLGCKAILVPTPGQKEQEYLAEIPATQKLFVTSPQKKFSLKKLLAEANQTRENLPVYDMDLYKKTVTEFVDGLRNTVSSNE
ncbi:MAG: glycosyltransferase [Chitinophagaceae bacterium]